MPTSPIVVAPTGVLGLLTSVSEIKILVEKLSVQLEFNSNFIDSYSLLILYQLLDNGRPQVLLKYADSVKPSVRL